MKKLLLTLLLAIVSSSAMAEWVKVGEAVWRDGSHYSVYVDPTTIRKSGNMVKMWLLYDYGTVQKHTGSSMLFASVKGQSEYDCKEEQSRILYQVLFSKNMGKGKRITMRDPDKWGPIEPNTIGVETWKFACGK